MNRYKSSSKFNKNFDNDIIFEDDFDNELENQHQHEDEIANNPRYKSIPSKAVFFEKLEETIEHINPNQVEELQVIKKDPSSEEIRLNNFFGSKKTLERKINNDKEFSPEYNPETRQRREVRSSIEENTNEKLKEMIQKQIEDRERWKNLVEEKQKSQREYQRNNHEHEYKNEDYPNYQTIDSVDNVSSGTYPLLINDQESFQKINSKQKLTKISQEKYDVANIEKNSLFGQNNEDGEYITPMTENSQKDLNPTELVPVEERKNKRVVSELRPLKKKISTYEVMNQLDMVSKPAESQLISLAENSSSIISNVPIIKLSPKASPEKIINPSITRIIGLDIKDFLLFANKTLEKDKYLEATVHRDRSCLNKAFFPEYRIEIDEVNVLYSKKTMRGYDIFLGDHEINVPVESLQKIGSVKGNFVGSYYNIFSGTNEDEVLATVFYNSEMTTKSAIRDVELYVRSTEISVDEIDYGLVYNRMTNLKTLHKINKNNEKITKFVPKQPFYHKETGMHQLDFGTNKVTMLSVNNVVLVNSQNHKEKSLVFGKSGFNNFYLRVENPLSPIVAMGYLMTSFNFKWVTQ